MTFPHTQPPRHPQGMPIGMRVKQRFASALPCSCHLRRQQGRKGIFGDTPNPARGAKPLDPRLARMPRGIPYGCPICINLTLDSRIAKGCKPFDGVWGVPKYLFSSPPQAARGVKGRAWGHPKPRKAGRSPWTPGLG